MTRTRFLLSASVLVLSFGLPGISRSDSINHTPQTAREWCLSPSPLPPHEPKYNVYKTLQRCCEVNLRRDEGNINSFDKKEVEECAGGGNAPGEGAK
jgi:hypothetical protein